MFFVFGKEEKGVKNVQQRARPRESFFFFWSRGCWGPFIDLARLKGYHFQMASG